MANPFVHLELNTPNLEKAKSFYKDLFGWEFQDMPMGPGGVYSTFKPSSGPGGGAYTMPQAPNGWLAYVGVEDVKQATEKAKSLGAQVHLDSQEIPNVGWFSVLSDPTGCNIAIFQPKQS